MPKRLTRFVQDLTGSDNPVGLMSLSVCLSVCLSVSLSVCLSLSLSIYLSLSLSPSLPPSLPPCLPLSLSLSLSVTFPPFLFKYLSIISPLKPYCVQRCFVLFLITKTKEPVRRTFLSLLQKYRLQALSVASRSNRAYSFRCFEGNISQQCSA